METKVLGGILEFKDPEVAAGQNIASWVRTEAFEVWDPEFEELQATSGQRDVTPCPPMKAESLGGILEFNAL